MKSLLQQVQSRISKRRNMISAIDHNIEFLLKVKALADLPDDAERALKHYRKDSKAMGDDQKLDKELYKMLLGQERTKYDAYFRSKYRSVRSLGPWHSDEDGIAVRGAFAQ